MATFTVTADSILVTLTRAEKLFALRRRDLRLPLDAVRAVSVEPEALRAAAGLRAPGLAIPSLVKIGTWRRPGSRSFVSARRSIPAVRVQLAGADLDALLVSTPDAEVTAAAIRAAAGGPPAQVAPDADARSTHRRA